MNMQYLEKGKRIMVNTKRIINLEVFIFTEFYEIRKQP